MCSTVIFDYVYGMTYATYKFIFMALPRIVDRECNVFGLPVCCPLTPTPCDAASVNTVEEGF